MQSGNSVKEFITAIYTFSEYCYYDKFNDFREEMICDRLVVGLCDKRVNKKLDNLKI